MKEIENLIEKYFEGETSLEEEKLLRDFFISNENIPAHLSNYVFIFSAWKEDAHLTLNARFDEKILSQISHTQKLHRMFTYSLSGIAATLLLGVFFLFIQDNNAYIVENGVRIDDEAVAMEVAAEVLGQVSLPLENSLQFIEPLQSLKSDIGSFEDISKLKTGMDALDFLDETQLIIN